MDQIKDGTCKSYYYVYGQDRMIRGNIVNIKAITKRRILNRWVIRNRLVRSWRNEEYAEPLKNGSVQIRTEKQWIRTGAIGCSGRMDLNKARLNEVDGSHWVQKTTKERKLLDTGMRIEFHYMMMVVELEEKIEDMKLSTRCQLAAERYSFMK